MISAREIEHQKYIACYRDLWSYKMGGRRMQETSCELKAIPVRGAYLDVSCGRGEMLDLAIGMGFSSATGTEIVPALIDGKRVLRAEVHELPFADKSFDVVTMCDVIEHLIPDDDMLACLEIARVARRYALLTASNLPSINPQTKQDLHINKRPYEEWDRLFREWFPGAVTWLKGGYVSEIWRIDLEAI